MRKIAFGTLLLALCLLLFAAQAENTDILGQPFPDFSVQTTDGETFTLSEALKEKQAVVINLWASWCGPCRAEFPHLSEAYAQRQEDVALIALSIEESDTLESIAALKKELGLSFPMGRDENSELAVYVQAYYIPTTVIVDRDGVARYLASGAVDSVEAALALMDPFLGDDYDPAGLPAAWIPVKRDWRVTAEEADVRPVVFMNRANPLDRTDYPILSAPEGRVTLLLSLAEGKADGDYLYDPVPDAIIPLEPLYDEETGAYRFDAQVPEEEDYAVYGLYTAGDKLMQTVVVARGEAGLAAMADEFESQGLSVQWEYTAE